MSILDKSWGKYFRLIDILECVFSDMEDKLPMDFIHRFIHEIMRYQGSFRHIRDIDVYFDPGRRHTIGDTGGILLIRNTGNNTPNGFDIKGVLRDIMAGGYTDDQIHDAYMYALGQRYTNMFKKFVPKFTIPDGLELYLNAISEEQEKYLIDKINSSPWKDVKMARRVQHYGYQYDYAKRGIGTRSVPVQGGGLWTGETQKDYSAIPKWLSGILTYLTQYGAPFYYTGPPNQIIVNEYTPGQGINAHTDASDFQEPIVSLSLGSTSAMVFRPTENGLIPDASVSVFLPRRSMVSMTRQSRYQYTHEIPSRKSDQDYNGDNVQRGTRLSLTFRIV